MSSDGDQLFQKGLPEEGLPLPFLFEGGDWFILQNTVGSLALSDGWCPKYVMSIKNTSSPESFKHICNVVTTRIISFYFNMHAQVKFYV